MRDEEQLGYVHHQQQFHSLGEVGRVQRDV
jgi:hypothetical protein